MSLLRAIVAAAFITGAVLVLLPDVEEWRWMLGSIMLLIGIATVAFNFMDDHCHRDHGEGS